MSDFLPPDYMGSQDDYVQDNAPEDINEQLEDDILQAEQDHDGYYDDFMERSDYADPSDAEEEEAQFCPGCCAFVDDCMCDEELPEREPVKLSGETIAHFNRLHDECL